MSRRKFAKEFKEEAVRRLELGASITEVARACELNPNVLRRWANPLSPTQLGGLRGLDRGRTELRRQVFTTFRELEYFSESELVTQTGYSKAEWWHGVLLKESVDNSLDACEQAGIAPEIRVELNGDTRSSDNGPGIPPEVVERILV